MCRPFLAFEKFFNKMLTFFCLRTEKLTCVNAIFPAILYNCGERKEDAMHIQDCLEEILHLEDTDLAASLADASRLFSCKKRQLVAKPDACSDWIPFLVSGVIRGYLTD